MRTVLSIIIAFIISMIIFFGAIFIFQYTIQDGKLIQIDETSVLEEKFYSQNFTKKKIFIVGSSMISALNATNIQEYLLKNNYDYEVYNLAIGSDKPMKRLKTIDMIIKAHPDIVVYGIGFRDIQDEVSDGQLKSQSFLPDPKQYFTDFLWNIDMHSKFDLDILKSTRIISFGVIDNILQKGIINPRQDKEMVTQYIFQNTPFFKYHKNDIISIGESVIETQIKEMPFYMINPPQKNKNAIALKKITHTLQENNINVIIFTTPYHKLFFEISPNYDENAFNTIVKDITYDTRVKVNFLHNKYNDTQIWNNKDHIVVNKNSTFYSEDIAKIILNETNP